MNLLGELSAIYGDGGASAYFGECVTTLEHSLQSAFFAREAKASDALILAALLHDIGHLIDSAPANLDEWVADARHEVSGSRWLAAHFGAEVSEPVRLHVPAKRYLCARRPGYFAQLSDASIRTLQMQGGPMSAADAAEFESQAYWRDAIQLRHWDDRGKIAGLRTPPFADYGELIERLRIQGFANGSTVRL
jgi:[1-hydroxy-2-(trimethylamino)ethyl]phosphonate dioxygenase